MSSTAIATLAEVSNNRAQVAQVSPAAQKRIDAYVRTGSEMSSTEAFYASFIERFPGLSVPELITKIAPKADDKERTIHSQKISKLLRETNEGRRLVTTGLVARAPVSGRPYWFLNVQREVGVKEAALLVPVRSPSVQKPRVALPKDVGGDLRDHARTDLNNWMELAGLGRRWRSQAVVQAAQRGVKSAITQVTRENNLALALSHALSATTGPMIVNMVRDIVAEQMLTPSSPTANHAAA